MVYHPQGLIFAGMGAGGSESCESELFYCQASFMNDSHIASEEQGLAAGNLPLRYELSQNYPNPFNPATIIRYALPHGGTVKLEVFDLVGRRVALLSDGLLPAGYHQKILTNSNLASGIYFYRLTPGNFCAF